jgi:Spy/CpxP family protein refolding chaperone
MARRIAWLVVVALAFGGGVMASAASAVPTAQEPPRGERRDSRDDREQDPNRRKWWLNAEDRKELGITDQQSATIEQIWASTAPKQRELWHEFEQLEAALQKALKDATADPASIAQQVDKVEKLRAQLNTNRTIMIYRISLVLKPEQRVKLEALRARREENRRKQQPDRGRSY